MDHESVSWVLDVCVCVCVCVFVCARVCMCMCARALARARMRVPLLEWLNEALNDMQEMSSCQLVGVFIGPQDLMNGLTGIYLYPPRRG